MGSALDTTLGPRVFEADYFSNMVVYMIKCKGYILLLFFFEYCLQYNMLLFIGE
jgi:hypothetical protein